MITESKIIKKEKKPEGISETISPYNPNFWNYIEKGIKPLLESFVHKGYLPYSSCEGHSIWGRRFISLAFPNLEEAERFISHINNLKESLISCNIKFSSEYYHDSKYGEYDEKGNTQWLNKLYFRGYSKYYFVEISIGGNSPPKIKNIGLILQKIFNRNRVTEKLKSFINSEKFEIFKS